MRRTLVAVLATAALLALPSSASASISDLSITASDSPDPVAFGADLTYTFVVTNNGPDSASSLSFNTATPGASTFESFSAPAGWTVGTTPAAGGTGSVTATRPSLNSGGVSLLTFVVKTTASGTLSNSAIVTSPTDIAPGNNSATTLTSVLPAAVHKKCKKRHRSATAAKKRCKRKKR